MRIKWTKGAQKNLMQIEEYIARDNPKGAVGVVIKIIKAVGLLSHNPAMGRVGRIFDTRELIISGTPFIVPYRIKSEQIEILRVFHSSMVWPDYL
ncbi:addiction module toxin, RelE/StbE family [Legionella massiliensis]|uniref:Addiction module toxin, RelE/StbE family n=1 Tax=Legionella massiliensis TaxID=1034943 RepID=A0A078L5Y2_9GAMM|nr:type II toxin-antitoxin system RelE/ParE family toxin [Legionella massiliensis]CDZ79464.1 addiction module toxin, RelE/StbE family [Legionella massiliensis]CEE15202.1 Plasmid stabilization system protein [Legionella massiliensis]